jgi:hypothetical protein
MKTTINQSDFVSAFKGNLERKNQFSYGALRALFDYYEELEQQSGEEFELDVVAICCDWTEYDTASAAALAYGWETDEPEGEPYEKEAFAYLCDKTQVINLDSAVVVLNF